MSDYRYVSLLTCRTIDISDYIIRQCRHDIDQLNQNNRNYSRNLSTEELSALLSLRSRDDTVIKLADQGKAVVLRTDKLEAVRQLSDTTSYFIKTIKLTIDNLIKNNQLPTTAINLIIRIPRHLLFNFYPGYINPRNKFLVMWTEY